MTFQTGVGIRKPYVEVPSLPAWLGLNRFKVLLLMARYASSQVIQLQSHGKYLCTNYGKGIVNENCMFTYIVLVRWPKHSLQLASWLKQRALCLSPSRSHLHTVTVWFVSLKLKVSFLFLKNLYCRTRLYYSEVLLPVKISTGSKKPQV